MTSLIFCRQVTLDNGTSAVILLNTMLSPVTATVDTLRIQLIYVSLILIALSLGLALFLSRRISRPIVQINEQSKQMAAGDYQSGLAPGITGKSANWLKPSTIRWLSWGVSKPCAAN